MKKYSSITRVNSHRISRNKKIKQAIILTVIGLFLLWLTPKLLAQLVAVVFSPIHATESWLNESRQSFPQFFRDRKELVEEINFLKSRTPEASSHKVTVAGLTAENAELRRLQSANNEERILAGVLARPNQVPYDVLILDRGSNDGVVVNAPVYIASSTVIGLVRDVFANTSVVELITTPGFKTTVYVYGPDIFTNAVGVGGGVLEVGVPQGVDLKEDDVVVLPTVSLGIFGLVNTVVSEPTSPEQYGYVTTDIPINSLRLVNIGKNPIEPVNFEEALVNVKDTISNLLTIEVPKDILVDLEFGTSTASTTASTTDEID